MGRTDQLSSAEAEDFLGRIIMKTYENAVGLDLKNPVRFIIDARPLPSALLPNEDCIDHIMDDRILSEFCTTQTPLRLVCPNTTLPDDPEVQSIPFNVSSGGEIIVMSAFPGETEPRIILYPPSSARQKMTPTKIEIPMFTLEYVIRPIPPNTPAWSVIDALWMSRQRFEGLICHDLLIKTLRSQRNLIRSEFGHEALAEAKAIIQRDCHRSPNMLLINPDAARKINLDIGHQNHRIRGLHPVLLNTSRRGVGLRSYVVSSHRGMGQIFWTRPAISRRRISDDITSIHCEISLGGIITERSAIVAIED